MPITFDAVHHNNAQDMCVLLVINVTVSFAADRTFWKGLEIYIARQYYFPALRRQS